MRIETLKIFCDVIKLKSFSKGAKENLITQSMASQDINFLENHLGTKLIDRAKRPWKLTNEGKLFYEECKDILDRYLKLESKVKGSHEEINSNVRIASIYSVGLRHMKNYVHEYSERYPNVKVNLEYLHPHKVYESVLNDEADLGFVSFPIAKKELGILPWREEKMVLACNPEHKLAGERGIDIKRINGEKFVHFDKDLTVRREVDRFLKNNKISVEVVLEFDNIENIKQAVEIGSGISILPSPVLDREVQSGILCAVPFIKQNFVRPLGIIYKKGKTFNNNVNRFIELVQKEKIN